MAYYSLIIMKNIEVTLKLFSHKIGAFFFNLLNISTLIFCDLCFVISMNALKRYIMYNFEIALFAGWVSKGN